MDMIRKIIAETFHIKEADIKPELEMQDIDGWDSLTHMELIANLESDLDIEFTADEIMEMTSIAKIEKLVGEKLNGN